MAQRKVAAPKLDSETEIRYMLCRLSHEWDWENFVLWLPKTTHLGGADIVIKCLRCGAERYESWSSTGELVHRHYKYPEGYQHLLPEMERGTTHRMYLRSNLARRLMNPNRRRRSNVS